ncbi:hypothetical protein GMDG_03979 [Pseudogymnoascus destructans 20631-21]|uniref:Uncharacterized protein n=1 Tax=Pseudogymnoascus destructans (strain ATCC MYA-4855 / 20631-21) TaxID=658429 RepID=L8G851_PSED2|nr:hypothetical protein GMDG_03979 [Pseudogymnoascus destructans 20631-21]
MTAQTPTTKTRTPITPTTVPTSQHPITTPLYTVPNPKTTHQSHCFPKSRDRLAKDRQAAIQALEMRAYLARRGQAQTQDVVTGKCECRDPYKAKREREKKEARKRRVEREGRRKRFEALKGKGKGKGKRGLEG